MNSMTLSVTLSVDRENTDDAYLDFNLTIDNEYIHPPESYVHPVDLVSSASHGGELFIFTCSCGDPSCLGIDEAVIVSHTTDTIRWRVRNPVGWSPEEPLPDWTQDVEFVFDKAEYVSAIKVALEQAKALLRHWNGPGTVWVGPGELSIDQFMDLDVPEDSCGIIAVVDSRAIH